ncbi:MAG: bifunctional demethylmenaquinone methyltransferase/2-methoxy-6-polyprenyl-1,4-benzoquinol methylase UbiE [Robiginitomaculum sp.]|nr:MAG: bifunctional demethylmenaquinone methyltransferase/2-methoxy-6-polyprenyl-1,4-benzoquinol methylase UbiE [Robiginitomaculum sp.]
MTIKSTKTNEESFGFRDVPKAEKAGLVREVFDRVADRYDLMNDFMSMGVHRIWKDMVIAKANPQPGELLIDVAGGTGDLSRRFLAAANKVKTRRGGQPAKAIVSDINAEMLLAGRKETDPKTITWVCGNAEQLPFADNTADVVTISFGIRNVTDKPRALRDMRRVLKPGGRFLCLEFSKPTSRALEIPYDFWSFNAIPVIGGMVSNDRDSYQYLVESIRKFPDQKTFAGMMEAAGFAKVSFRNFTGGVAALHTGWKI